MKRIDDKLYLNRFIPDHQSHLKIINKGECKHECKDRPCTILCPAQVYAWDREAQEIAVAYEGCVECGTCRYGCPFDNIDWRNPRGGYGVMWKFG